MFRRLGLALRILRELSGSSQAALARKAGVGKSQLSKYESGKEKPKLDVLEKVLSALDARPPILFYVADLLERIAREEIPRESLVSSEAGTLSPRGEREAYAKVVLDLAELFEAQIEGRVRSAITSETRSRLLNQ